MTKEYALWLLNQLMIGASVDAKPIIPQYELAQALDLAIKALEQQPCEDCISRQAVKEILMKYEKFYEDRCETYIPDVTEVEIAIDDLLSVTPRRDLAETSQDCISRQVVLDYAKDTCLDLDKYEDTEAFCDEIKNMSSVYPKRPKGKWIIVDDCEQFIAKCSVCEKTEDSRLVHRINFCSNCGAYMGGEEDEVEHD